jgi:hypothetical protein
MNWRTHQFVLASSGIALGGGMISRTALSTRTDGVLVIVGSVLVVMGLTSVMIALFSSRPTSATDATMAMTPDALLAAIRQYARRGLVRRFLVIVWCLFVLGDVVRFVASLAERRWALAGANGLWLAGMGVLSVFIIGSDIQRTASPFDESVGDVVEAPSRRLPAKNGWYQEDGRWYCETHNTRYCKLCSPRQGPSA